MEWGGLKDVALLTLIESERFNVFLTGDKNMSKPLVLPLAPNQASTSLKLKQGQWPSSSPSSHQLQIHDPRYNLDARYKEGSVRKQFLLACLCAGLCAQTHPLQTMIEAARAQSPALKDLLTRSAPNLKNQGAAFVWGQDFLFAVETGKDPSVSIDGQPPVSMTRVPDSDIWYRLVKMRTGVTHAYQFNAEGKALFPRRDMAGYNPESYPKPGEPKGTLSEKKTNRSKL